MAEKNSKPIIIDGIDVSGCKHFKIGTCLADYLLTDMNFSEAKCELCKNCYYKQLKHKEQECEKLKAELKNFQDMAKKGLDEFKDVGGCWGCGLQLQLNQDIQDINQLKAENEKLKDKIKYMEGYIKTVENARNELEENNNE